MLTFINCAILWAEAAFYASSADAELCGADASNEEVSRIANIYLTSGNFHHLAKIKFQLDLEERYNEADDVDRWIAAHS